MHFCPPPRFFCGEASLLLLLQSAPPPLPGGARATKKPAFSVGEEKRGTVRRKKEGDKSRVPGFSYLPTGGGRRVECAAAKRRTGGGGRGEKEYAHSDRTLPVRERGRRRKNKERKGLEQFSPAAGRKRKPAVHLIINPKKVRRTRRAYQTPQIPQLRCLFGQDSHTGGESRLSILRAGVVVPLLYIARYRGRGGGGAGGGQYAPLTFPLPPFPCGPMHSCTRNGYVSFLCLRAGCELVCVCVCVRGKGDARGGGGMESLFGGYANKGLRLRGRERGRGQKKREIVRGGEGKGQTGIHALKRVQ